MTTERDELLPCPFCGGDAHPAHVRYSRPVADTAWDDGSPITEAHYVSCARCSATAGQALVGGRRTEAEAITAWNTRTPTVDRGAVLEEAARVAEHYNFGPERTERDNARNAIAQIIAAAIRALKTTPNTTKADHGGEARRCPHGILHPWACHECEEADPMPANYDPLTKGAGQ